MKPFFIEVSNGYCYKQAAERAGLEHSTVLNTIYSDDDTAQYLLDLCMVAGAKIRAGEIPVPARYDGLYDEYLANSK